MTSGRAALVANLGTESLREAELFIRMKVARLPEVVTQVALIPKRRFRYDFVFPDHRVAVELQGGVFSNGRHNRGTGYEADCEKLALAQLAGYIVLQVTPGHVKSGKAVEWITAALRTRGWAQP